MKRVLLMILILPLVFVMNNCSEDKSDDTGTDTVKDKDGNTYKTIKIGNQVWMAENLKTTHFNNGDEIPTSTSYPMESFPIYQWPAGGEESNVAIYGRLYTWATLTDSRGVCPVGWHIPSDDEWIEMEKSLGLIYPETTSGQIGTIEGGKLKEAGLTHWLAPNTGATNESGFTALPAGVYALNGYSQIGNFASFWTSSTSYSNVFAWTHEMNKSFEKIYHYDSPISLGKSCRCVKD